MYKQYRRGTNIIDGLDTALSADSVSLAASGVRLMSTIIATPVAIGIQAGSIVCGLLGADGKFNGWRIQSKARKHYKIRSLAEAKLNKIADRILTALTVDNISDEEFRLILSEVDKYDFCSSLKHFVHIKIPLTYQ